MSPPYRVLAVRYATRETSKAEAYYRYHAYGEPDAPLRMDYYFWLLEGKDGTIVVDTGYDPEVAARLGRRTLCEPVEAFRLLGVDPFDVEQVIVTHLHWDHVGNLDLFADARLTVAQRELDFWTGPYARRHHFAEVVVQAEIEHVRAAACEGRVALVTGEQEIAPGIVAVDVGGHSPGQLVLAVETARGRIVLASDAIHYYEELALDRPFAVLADLAECYSAFDTLRRLSEGSEAAVVAGHDPLVMERFDRLEGKLGELAVEVA
jgi:glyoxylase-like metal-dependent hydrolase (beta-lactamase superfamily II)